MNTEIGEIEIVTGVIKANELIAAGWNYVETIPCPKPTAQAVVFIVLAKPRASKPAAKTKVLLA